MNNFNYFFTPVGPEYKKKFARNVGIAVLILFAFYGIMHLVGDISNPEQLQSQRLLSDPICFVADRTSSGNTGSGVTMDVCFTLKQFEEMRCTKPMLKHLYKHSNILDFESDGAYYLDFIGLPDGMSQEKFEECWDVILEKRTNLLENTATELELGIILRYEKYLDENNELNFAQQYDNNGIIIDDLQRIHDWCDYAGEKPVHWYFEWNNQTHHINSENCKWEENSDSSPIPDLVVNRDNGGNLSSHSCPVNQTYNQILFKCVISCEDDLVYNGYTDSCTTEFELKYHGFCNDEFTYDPSSHTCYSDDGASQIPLKDPPRTAPPEPEPEPIPDSESLQRPKQQQAKLGVREIIIQDTRVHENKINAIRDYREEFESGYFLEQFIIPNKQNFEKDELINFVYGEWGYQPKENTSVQVDVYFRSYDNYDKIEKINEWQKPKDDTVFAITSDSDGYLLMDLWGMPPAIGVHETCVIPGEYRVSASNIEDKSKVEWGYFTCQRDKLFGEPQPWMEIPE